MWSYISQFDFWSESGKLRMNATNQNQTWNIRITVPFLLLIRQLVYSTEPCVHNMKQVKGLKYYKNNVH